MHLDFMLLKAAADAASKDRVAARAATVAPQVSMSTSSAVGSTSVIAARKSARSSGDVTCEGAHRALQVRR